MRPKLIWWLIPLVLAIGVLVSLFLTRGDDPSVSADGGTSDQLATSAAMLEVRETLLGSPQDLDLTLTVTVPEGTDADDDEKQEIKASGPVDLAEGAADLSYDFVGLHNAGGFLGHFTELDVVWADEIGYFRAFIDGPQWISIAPSNAVGNDLDRLRGVVLTSPLSIPGFLAAEGVGGASGLQVTPSTLAASDDAFAAEVGASLEALDVETVEINSGGATEVRFSFAYPAPDRPTKDVRVDVLFTFAPTGEAPGAEAPDESDVRQFSDIFG